MSEVKLRREQFHGREYVVIETIGDIDEYLGKTLLEEIASLLRISEDHILIDFRKSTFVSVVVLLKVKACVGAIQETSGSILVVVRGGTPCAENAKKIQLAKHLGVLGLQPEASIVFSEQQATACLEKSGASYFYIDVIDNQEVKKRVITEEKTVSFAIRDGQVILNERGYILNFLDHCYEINREASLLPLKFKDYNIGESFIGEYSSQFDVEKIKIAVGKRSL